MNVVEAIAARRSVRAFLDKEISQALLRRVLARAARAPSGGNLQPWRIYVLTGAPLASLKERMRARLAVPSPDPLEYDIYPEKLWEPYRTERFRVGEMLFDKLGIPRDNRKARVAQFHNNYEFFGAPAGLFCYIDRRMGLPQWSDLGMYLENVMLLLCEEGLASCPQESWSTYNRVVAAALSPPPELMLFCGMAIGYEDASAPVNRLRTERMKLEEFVTFMGFER
jgi:nitroreductase